MEWERYFPGEGDGIDRFYDVHSVDGGYIVAGQNDSFGGAEFDVWLLRVGENGDCGDRDADASSNVVNTSATVTDSTATVTDSTATVTDTNATVRQQEP